MKFAPNWTISHIQEYANKIQSNTHTGLALALECILKDCPNNTRNASLSAALLEKRPKCVKTDSSKFATSLNARAKYHGEVRGMLEAYGENEISTLSEKLLENIRNACKSRSDIQHRNALWRATALLIITPDLNRKLLQCIASSQVLRFFYVINIGHCYFVN